MKDQCANGVETTISSIIVFVIFVGLQVKGCNLLFMYVTKKKIVIV
jgi:hypothetical protein